MKHLKFLPLIFVFLLCGCSSNEDTQEDTAINPTVTLTPEKQMVTYTDEIVKYSFDTSLLQHCYYSDNATIQEGVVLFSKAITSADAITIITDSSCVYSGLMALESSEQYTTFQQNPDACVKALFTGVFGIADDSEVSINSIDDIYEFNTTYKGYICKGKLLHCTKDCCIVEVYKVAETEDAALIHAFDELYDSITVSPKYFSSSNTTTNNSIDTEVTKPTPTEIPETITDNFWDSIVNQYPSVSYDDIKDGAYKKQYVILSATLDSVEYYDYMNWVQCNAWFLHGDSYVACNITFMCDELLGYSPKLLQPGDNIDICFFINSDNSFGSTIKAFNHNKNQISLEEIYDCFKQKCSPMNWENVMRNPDSFYGTTFSLTGNVFQIISDNDNRIELLLSTEANEYIYVSYSYKSSDLKILENDTLTIYGTFYKLYKYTSVLGTYHSIPSIVAELIE